METSRPARRTTRNRQKSTSNRESNATSDTENAPSVNGDKDGVTPEAGTDKNEVREKDKQPKGVEAHNEEKKERVTRGRKRKVSEENEDSAVEEDKTVEAVEGENNEVQATDKEEKQSGRKRKVSEMKSDESGDEKSLNNDSIDKETEDKDENKGKWTNKLKIYQKCVIIIFSYLF